jgi:hypothetical protein
MLCRQSGVYKCLACEDANERQVLSIAEGTRFPACPAHKTVWWILETPILITGRSICTESPPLEGDKSIY